MLVDDRPSSLDRAFDRQLHSGAPAIRADAEDWLRQLLSGTRRSHPRSRETVGEYLRTAAPLLRAWFSSHDHLAELPAGSARTQALISLRSLFRYLRSQRQIFRNPTTRLAPGSVSLPAILPLSETDYQQVVAAATTPEHRMALALSAVRAARPGDIRRLQLDDVDLGDRRVTIAGHVRRLDDLSLKVIKEYLVHRRARWPSTANPHLLVSKRTVYDTRPVTSYYINNLFRGHKATLDRLRVDRWLEEALNRGPDPLHLAAVFGISTASAIRYAQAARQILEDDTTPP
ncbi:MULTISPECIES: hypothetical protein [unclassified Streptomyces]|uniref:hypothetical protein n=1 Tax=unclassified Streptomyces TaxID=2593676 RepID=UPI003D937014